MGLKTSLYNQQHLVTISPKFPAGQTCKSCVKPYKRKGYVFLSVQFKNLKYTICFWLQLHLPLWIALISDKKERQIWLKSRFCLWWPDNRLP